MLGFNGTIDGNNYTITFNNRMDAPGFITELKDKGVIKNLNMVFDTWISAYEGQFGAISRINYGLIENCNIIANLCGYTETSAGGICFNNSGNIKNCTVDFCASVSRKRN